MLTIPRPFRIFIGSTPIDMRKSIDGLMAIVQEDLEQEGKNVAGLFSLIATCEANGVNPTEYLADVLMRADPSGFAHRRAALAHLGAASVQHLLSATVTGPR